MQWKKKGSVLFLGLVFCLVAAGIIMAVRYSQEKQDRERKIKEVQEHIQKENAKAIIATASPTVEPESLPAATTDPTKSIYTFLQGPKSWKERREWSGVWGKTICDGASFGGFGCGLCCMANIYSSLTPYECTPMEMYDYAKKVTYYGGGGAIDWGYMKETMLSLGLSCDVYKKPKSYKAFKKSIASAQCSLVLVSSYNSECYWKDTPGHYVTIFLYDEETDKVFLADSGDPEHNRQWVSLKKIYRSLKTSSSWQYINVDSYNEEKCEWKKEKAEGKWVRPKQEEEAKDKAETEW